MDNGFKSIRVDLAKHYSLIKDIHSVANDPLYFF